MIEHRPLVKSFQYALEGVWFTVKYNQNIRIHLVVAALGVLASIFFQVSAFEMGILGIMILLVISAEMINTALEEMTNLITKEHSQEAKIAKDVSAGMVLLVSVGSIVVGVLVFLPHVLRLFRAS